MSMSKKKSYKMKSYKMKSHKGMKSSKKKSSKKGKSHGHYPQFYGKAPSYSRPNPSPYKGGSPSYDRPKSTPSMTKGTSNHRLPGLSTYSKKMSSKSNSPSGHQKKASGLSPFNNKQLPNNGGYGDGKKLPAGRNSPFNYGPTPALPKPYFLYSGEGKGNRGIDVFVFGGTK